MNPRQRHFKRFKEDMSRSTDGLLSRGAARELAGAAMRIEQLATWVFEATPTTVSRADDVAVVVLGRGPSTLADAVEQ